MMSIIVLNNFSETRFLNNSLLLEFLPPLVKSHCLISFETVSHLKVTFLVNQMISIIFQQRKSKSFGAFRLVAKNDRLKRTKRNRLWNYSPDYWNTNPDLVDVLTNRPRKPWDWQLLYWITSLHIVRVLLRSSSCLYFKGALPTHRDETWLVPFKGV